MVLIRRCLKCRLKVAVASKNVVQFEMPHAINLSSIVCNVRERIESEYTLGIQIIMLNVVLSGNTVEPRFTGL